MKRREIIRNMGLTCLAMSAALTAASASAVAPTGGASIEQTKHNLTAGGPGTVKTAAQGETCVFCHTPHAASPRAPLWNRQDPGTYYQTYESSTLKAEVGQPTGSSRLCLSCHDGTIALTQTYNSRNTPAGGTVYLSPGDAGYIGTDLSDDHPISFEYTSSLTARDHQLVDPAALPHELPLDSNQQLQCTTCHDAHDDSLGQFLRVTNLESRLCVSCHNVTGWTASTHAQSARPLSSATERWENLRASTVAEAGCESCHRPHSAGGRQRLLRHEAEEVNCLVCHDGGVSDKDIAGEIAKTSAHNPRQSTGVHDPTEIPGRLEDHVECADCHNAHRATGGTANAPMVKPSMQGVSGVSASGLALESARYEYEVCFKCHAGDNMARFERVSRVLGSNDLSEEFATVNQSFHPVEAPGRNTLVPSLRQGLTAGSMIYCTDCHSSDDDRTAGPHGSRHRSLLKSNHDTLDGAIEGPQSYELCYSCHNRQSILGNESFSEHSRHIVEEHTPCSACHDPHGVRQNTHLMNFDRDVVEAVAPNIAPIFTDRGVTRGSCTLTCHGETHNDRTYPDD